MPYYCINTYILYYKKGVLRNLSLEYGGGELRNLSLELGGQWQIQDLARGCVVGLGRSNFFALTLGGSKVFWGPKNVGPFYVVKFFSHFCMGSISNNLMRFCCIGVPIRHFYRGGHLFV